MYKADTENETFEYNSGWQKINKGPDYQKIINELNGIIVKIQEDVTRVVEQQKNLRDEMTELRREVFENKKVFDTYQKTIENELKFLDKIHEMIETEKGRNTSGLSKLFSKIYRNEK